MLLFLRVYHWITWLDLVVYKRRVYRPLSGADSSSTAQDDTMQLNHTMT